MSFYSICYICAVVSSNLETAAMLKLLAGCLWRCDVFLILKLVFGLICPLTISFNVRGSSFQKISGPWCPLMLSPIQPETTTFINSFHLYGQHDLCSDVERRNLCFFYTHSRISKEVKMEYFELSFGILCLMS